MKIGSLCFVEYFCEKTNKKKFVYGILLARRKTRWSNKYIFYKILHGNEIMEVLVLEGNIREVK